MNSPVLAVHQTLHGYSDGHRLLEASLELPPDARREMLLLSDGPGLGAPRGFEESFSAYPMATCNLYAVARTWPAPEVRRAGCVWTHTLLLDFADLARIETFDQVQALRSLWSRPPTNILSTGKLPTLYRTALRLDLDTAVGAVPRLPVDGQTFDALLNALYGEAAEAEGGQTAVFLSAPNSEIWHDAAWALWLQLWPRLRRQFAFCSGTTMARRVGGRSFDLQIALPSALATLRRDEPRAAFIGFGLQPPPVEASQGETNEWLRYLRADVSSPSLALRAFLRLFGADSGESRVAVSRLTSIFALLNEPSFASLEPLFRRVARHYPRATEAQNLKSTVFGVPAPHPWLHADESLMLESLATTPFWRMFSSASLRLEDRAAELWRHRRETAETLLLGLLQRRANPLAERLLTGVARIISGKDAARILSDNWTLASLFVRHQPALATSPALWLGPHDLRRALLDALPDVLTSEAERARVGAALFTARADDVAADAGHVLGADFVRGALRVWGEVEPASDEAAVPATWRNTFATQPALLVEWLQTRADDKNGMERGAALLTLLSPDAAAVRQMPVSFWLEMARTARFQLTGRPKAETMAFILALGLDNFEGQGFKLVEVAFESVHEAQQGSRLGYTAWQWLEPHVPTLGETNWDKCERLRRALIGAFEGRHWPEGAFLRATERHDTFVAVLRSAAQMSNGKEFIKHIRQQTKLGTLTAAMWQLELLRDKKSLRDLWESLLE